MSASHEASAPFTSQFSGQDITTVFWNGRPCWTAKDIGRPLGYGNGGLKLAQRVIQDWASEFIEGQDYLLVLGQELADFKELLKLSPDSGDSAYRLSPEPGALHARQLVILFETGVNMVCMKTRKAAGQHLRRWLASEVLPTLRETGSYELGQPRRDADAQHRVREDITAAAVQRREDIKTLALRRREAVAFLKDAKDFGLVSEAYVTRYVQHSVAIVDGTVS